MMSSPTQRNYDEMHEELVRCPKKLNDFRVPRVPMLSNCELLDKRDNALMQPDIDEIH
jgi:hypothetical protein